MDNTDNKHKGYSRTDTSKVNLSEEEWKKSNFRRMYIILPG